MDIVSWYAMALSSLILASILAYVLFSVVAVVQYCGKNAFLKYLFYPQIPKFLRRSGRTSWFDLLVLLMFLGANAVALSAGVRNATSFIRRSGIISVVNLIPLFLGGQMNIIASHCGLSLRAYTRLHRWLGSVAIVEGLLHVIVSVSRQMPNFKLKTNVAGLVVLSIFVTIPPSGLLRRRLYEVFLSLHFTLSLAVLAALYLHKPTSISESPTVYLFAAVCLLVLTGCVRFGLVLYRNVRYGRPLSRASVRTITFKRSTGEDIPLSDAVHLHIRLSRTWKHRAGQYVYLCIPGVSHTSFAQLHPFYVAWWYRDGGYDYAVFIMQKQRGFTDRVFSHRASEYDKVADLVAVIEGPYGKELNLDSYGTVLLFATGIGIASQLPYVAQLLDGYQNCEVKTRRITLFWQVDSEIQTAWVADRMQQLLRQDTGRILDIHIHVLGNFLSRVTDRGDYIQLGERIDMTYGPLRVREVIDNEMKHRKGRTVISMCADDEISDAIRNLVRGMTNEMISLKELDFRPGTDTLMRKQNPATA
ncbi:ferric reductase transmembrane component 3 [Thelonectria olida]|uniref:ferric-chelate reductase (NADPH) n=1 Tax=Thelonectria olida TaxID=1576542 RepID=A0A9P8VXU6_9HYPO|nr:ferric reductase transmembrane component 3 [Thelonectria olida]